jgi:hypothetical protein
MVFNVSFNNISVIAWRSVLLVEEMGVPGETHRPTSSHCNEIEIYHNLTSTIHN